jgi:Lon-like ATP-dependent protease
MAWTELGGTILYIETRESTIDDENQDKPGTGQLTITGSLGKVMKESVAIAHTLAKNFLHEHFPNHKAAMFFDYHDIHVHVPEGSTPKDGPSAGITLTTALLSLALDKAVTQDIAMTGEITLQGKVLKIGGLKEKVLAAQREQIKKVIVPKENKKDFMKLPDFLKEGIEITYAENYEDVFKVMFPDMPLTIQADLQTDSKPVSQSSIQTISPP